jgi:hypothetical protein
MPGRKVRIVVKWESRLTEMVRWISVFERLRRGVPWAMPALLIRIVGVPSWEKETYRQPDVMGYYEVMMDWSATYIFLYLPLRPLYR